MQATALGFRFLVTMTGASVGRGNRPLVTIGVTTYDRPEMLKECVDSILAQTYPNIEVIIANDFVARPVTFASLALAPDPRVRIVNHPENIGAFRNNHFLPVAAKGEWFTWLADDDLMHPEFLEIAWEIFSRNPVNAVFSNYLAAISPQGVFPRPVSRRSPRVLGGREFIGAYSAREIRTVGSYGVFRRDLFERFGTIGRFGTGLPVYGDTFIPIFAASLGRVAYVDLDLVFLRTHMESRSASSAMIEDYASAQRDFMAALRACCIGCASPADLRGYLENMVRWFAADNWAVICRAHESIIRRIAAFFDNATAVLLPMADSRDRAMLARRMVAMAGRESARLLGSRLLARLRPK